MPTGLAAFKTATSKDGGEKEWLSIAFPQTNVERN